MSGPLPAPDFDAQNYARPNQDWICGHACEGNACRPGPDAKGRCRATAECKPVLELQPGQTKGRWKCTRTGGSCEAGPLPDGSCCRPIAKCSPVPTLRWWRGRLTLAVIAAACAGLLVVLGHPAWRNHFISPGEISQPHAGGEFMALAATNHLNPGCGACHVAGNTGPNGLLNAALRADPGMLDLKRLALAQAATPTAIDESCLKCHIGRNIHQASAPVISCSFCHAEHQGKAMAATTDESCNFCHGVAAKMAVAAGAGNPPVPVVQHFPEAHPEFRFITEQQRDPDTLKFDHALHLTSETIPKLPGGKKLDCTFCHQPDAAGALMQPVAFEKNCRVCHSLQFDQEKPQLMLPHGSVEFVSAYLRNVAREYPNRAGLRTQFGSGEGLERRIFFSQATYGPEVQIGTLSGATRALFPGCAYCHEVNETPSGAPQITRPVQAERWLAQAKFSHAPHANIACAQCHDAVHSKNTEDIILPPKKTCAECHSPRGGVADTCAECHTYHKLLMAAR